MIVSLAGMHRSGTSLMASYLEKNGISMGKKMVKAAAGNVKGHFEDKEFVEFHKKALRKNWSTIFNPPRHIKLTDEMIKEAESIIKDKIENFDNWGWKDPRTSLFLDFWHEYVPDAKYLCLYRPPSLVIDSLIRRKGDRELYLFFWWAGKAWIRYNQDILDFYNKHKSQCIFINIVGFNSNSIEGTKVLEDFLNYKLEVPYSEVYSPKYINNSKKATGIYNKLNELVLGKEMSDLYNQLESISLIDENGTIKNASS